VPGRACSVWIYALITQLLAKTVSKLELLATFCCHPIIELGFNGRAMACYRAALGRPRYVGVDALSTKRCTELVCPREIFGTLCVNPFIEHGIGSICRNIGHFSSEDRPPLSIAELCCFVF
jgi:hypothetical protein